MFAKVQERDLLDRKTWLKAQLDRNGVFTTEYNSATFMPKSFSATGYAGKLFVAYKALGGHPETEMLLRTSDQPVFLTQGTNIAPDGTDTSSGFSDMFSNGRRNRGGQRFDRDIGMQVDRLKSWQLEAIKRKRERLEFKIKRALDYSDQLQREIEVINILLNADGGATVDDQIQKVELYMFRTGAQNVVSDILDVFGFGIGKPLDPTNPSDYKNEKGADLR